MQGPLTDRIVAAFDAMPAQIETAARYVLDQPSDVALLSMREQARQAGVQPATMTRLAKQLGLAGDDDVREMYAEMIRGAGPGFFQKAGAQVTSQKVKGDRALAADMDATLNAGIVRLAEPGALDRPAAAAARLASARRIYCLGLRSCHAIAWHLHLVEDRSSKTPFGPKFKLNARVKREAMARGLMVYPSGGTIDGARGDHVLIAPPFNVDAQQIDTIVERLVDAAVGGLGTANAA